MFKQRNVISSKYTISKYVHNVPRQKLKVVQITYIMHIEL